MYMQQRHPDYPIKSTSDHALPVVQARRRQLLGLILLVVGTVWFTLRLFGQVGDLPMPICWIPGPAVILDHFNLGCNVAPAAEAAYGILLVTGFRHIQESYGE